MTTREILEHALVAAMEGTSFECTCTPGVPCTRIREVLCTRIPDVPEIAKRLTEQLTKNEYELVRRGEVD